MDLFFADDFELWGVDKYSGVLLEVVTVVTTEFEPSVE
jgi:hypothetical protein